MMHLYPWNIDGARSRLCDQSVRELNILIAPRAVKALIEAANRARGI